MNYKIRGQHNEILSENIGKNTIISGWTFIGKNVKIGKNCRFGNFVNIDMNTQIGDNVNIQSFSYLTIDSIIEDNISFGPHVKFIDEKYASPFSDKKIRIPIVIKKDALIGGGVTIVCSTVGQGSVVGANSLVLEDIPPNQILAGSPAKPITIKNSDGTKRPMTRKDFDDKRHIMETKVRP